jgi:hypothetical protein
MVEKTKKQKKGSISEDDVSAIFKRYTAKKVLTLLEEVAQVADVVKIDWNEMVKKTNTGISSAREYQMLWRHLAYRDCLLNTLDDVDQPLDDDSDLEYEVEPSPKVSNDVSFEAAAVVKVLAGSASLSDPSLPSGTAIEGPLTINIPICESSGEPVKNSQPNSSTQGKNIIIPVYVRKQLGPGGETTEANGSASGHAAHKRKRKLWNQEEDDKLKAAVEKFGEGNWAAILKEYFNCDRKASQLSQRWAIIRKRPGNTGASGSLAAAHRAMSLELDRPNTKPSHLIGSSVGQQFQLSQQEFGSTTAAGQRPPPPPPPPPAATPPSIQSRVRLPPKSGFVPDKMVQAAAVAAGARIASASDAASLLQAAKAKNAVHIMPVGGHLMKSNSSQLPPNVHFIRTTPPPPRLTRPAQPIPLIHQPNKILTTALPNAIIVEKEKKEESGSSSKGKTDDSKEDALSETNKQQQDEIVETSSGVNAVSTC